MRKPSRVAVLATTMIAAIGVGVSGAAIGGAAAAGPSADPVATLRADLNAILANKGLDGASYGLIVRTASGKVLYEKNADTRLEPASNTKIFTSTTALNVLGPSYRFNTTVLDDGHRHGSVLVGSLSIRGGGDPTLLATDYDSMAAAVARSGIRAVTGNLVADDSFFDNVRLGVGWAWDDEPYYYDAQISGLNVAPNTDYDTGTVIVDTTPGAVAGVPAHINLVPATGYVHIVNRTTTTTGTHSTIDVERQHGNNTIVVNGTIGRGFGTDREWATVWQPTGYAADVFRRALRAHGVSVAGRTLLTKTPAGSTRIATHTSATLADIYIPFLKLSNNMHAETLVKTMGAVRAGHGSWPAGLGVMRPVLQGFGVDTATSVQVDGSGLSRMDYIPPRQFSNALVAVQNRPWFRTWYKALPIAGAPGRFVGGTLEYRMIGTPAQGRVHAKTGSLTGVSALSGYDVDADGHRLVFSMIENNVANFDPETVEDQVAIRLAEFSTRPGALHGIPAVPATRRGPVGVDCRTLPEARVC
ncbi:MAG: D-alanyl-D-alanine carboxypeptidase/D-alanyl-D-alanine endopeptidase [Mycobacteriales bacterium]